MSFPEEVELQVQSGAVFVSPRSCSAELEEGGTIGGSEHDFGRDVDVGGHHDACRPVPVVEARIAQVVRSETGVRRFVGVLVPCRIQAVPYGETAEMEVFG